LGKNRPIFKYHNIEKQPLGNLFIYSVNLTNCAILWEKFAKVLRSKNWKTNLGNLFIYSVDSTNCAILWEKFAKFLRSENWKKKLGNLFIFSVNATNCAIISEKFTNFLYQKNWEKTTTTMASRVDLVWWKYLICPLFLWVLSFYKVWQGFSQLENYQWGSGGSHLQLMEKYPSTLAISTHIPSNN